ncbi:P1 family peptidase [Brevibacillus fulvus]|uniref:D-aminopeptidase n=1 Tax=Brevibacillus fulvus TaxID=1125967 RepID=A0A938XUH7_9BACL|nr:P1 family peptidase [Brevibacillus fulvus]MBM7590708.1 D-aminopeptidase [Brevibacillus fulvus]
MKRVRLRELGYTAGKYSTGSQNSITDVNGVKVGHVTLQKDLQSSAAVRTGVTAVLPHGGNLFQEKVLGAAHVINGFGKTTGLVQLEELGLIESPILLTNTLSVPAAQQGAIAYMLKNNPELGGAHGTVNVIVGECNDGYLNDIRGMHVTPEHAIEAIERANAEQVEEGAVGAGTGMSCLGYKGGIGSSSRIVMFEQRLFTVGALVVSNFGRAADWQPGGWIQRNDCAAVYSDDPAQLPDGSIMIVLATDAPLNERQLKRLAKRAAFGLARAGSYAAHGSGDIAIAFSTAQRFPHLSAEAFVSSVRLQEGSELLNHLFAMAAEAVHESILNSLCKADGMHGHNGHYRAAFPYESLNDWL